MRLGWESIIQEFGRLFHLLSETRFGYNSLTVKKTRRRIFLDHASTTPLLPEVYSTVSSYLTNFFANPSALYQEGVRTASELESLRRRVAKTLSAHSDEIVFTGSGTESDNLALFGVFEAARRRFPCPHFISSAIEHPAILEALRVIEKRGGKVTYLPVSRQGFIAPGELARSLTAKTVLVSIMYANNEIGTIQPIREITKVVRHFRKKKALKFFPYVHTDASQAANYLSLSVPELGVDLLTLDGSKIYGPKGVGALFVRRTLALAAQIVGGGQERGLRSGTENLPAIAGFTLALEIVQKDREDESARLSALKRYFLEKLFDFFPSAELSGARERSLPNIVNVCFPGADAEFLVLQLDARGILASASSSCRTLAENVRSYVIESLGKKHCSESSLRLSFGRSTTKRDIEALLQALRQCLPHS